MNTNKNLKRNVSVELITDPKMAMNEVGLDFYDNSLYPSINLEAPRDRTPVLIKTSDNKYGLVFKNVEMGNYLPHGRAVDIVRKNNIKLASYSAYFIITDKDEVLKVAPDETTTLYNMFPVDTVTVNSDIPVARYIRYKSKFNINIKPDQSEVPIYVYEVDKKEVASIFSEVHSNDEKIAERFIDELLSMNKNDKKDLKGYLKLEKKDQFEVLNDLMKQKGISSILADTKLTIHMFTALPWDEIEEGSFLAFYDGKQALILSPRHIDNKRIKLLNRFDNLSKAIENITGQDTIIGFEGMSLDIGRALSIGLHRLTDITYLLGLWRDRMAYQELAYYIIDIQANRYAMENALAFTGEALRKGETLTEIDVENKFIELLGEFRAKYGCTNLDFKKYFVVLHAGARSPYPALSSNYKLNMDMKTLKLDAGVFLFKDGILRSATDICRSLVLTDEGKEVYEILGANIRRDVIPNIKVGMTGEDTYWLGLSPLAKLEGRLKNINMLAKDFSLKDRYNRDIGHTISKEESRTISIEKGNTTQQWEAFMFGCIEYQWPYAKHTIGIEDMFLVTPYKTLNITI